MLAVPVLEAGYCPGSHPLAVFQRGAPEWHTHEDAGVGSRTENALGGLTVLSR